MRDVFAYLEITGKRASLVTSSISNANMDFPECKHYHSLYCEAIPLNPEKRISILDDAFGKVKRVMREDFDISLLAEEHIYRFSCSCSYPACKIYSRIPPTSYVRDLGGGITTFFPFEIRMPKCACSLSLGDIYGREATKFYHKFLAVFEGSLTNVVMPSLEGKRHEEFLSMLIVMWIKYKTMAHWLFGFCEPYVEEGLPITMMCDLVFDVQWHKVQEAIIFMMNKEREGRLIDQGLLRTPFHFAFEMQMFTLRPYYEKLEERILINTVSYYSNLASEWLSYCTFGDYIKKYGDWFEREWTQKRNYLEEFLVKKLVEIARIQLMVKPYKEVAVLIPSKGSVGIVQLGPKRNT